MGMKLGYVKSIILEIPFTPPSVNHYKKPITLRTSNGPRLSFALTDEARAFRDAVAIFARGQTLVPLTATERTKIRYALTVTVFLGKNESGDADNYWKCIADSLVKAGVIHSDARVRRWHIEVEDEDRQNPRTLICASVCQKRRTLAERLHDLWKREGKHGTQNLR
jgi:Holliday junction resolvase RusA-like endonuclease